MVQLVPAKKEVVNRVEVDIQAVAEVVTFNTQIAACEVTIPMNIAACEVTMPMNIMGSNVMVPLDIQSSFVAVPIDIQAQYLNLDIDIVAQTIGNIKMDIAAQTIGNIKMDIAAQTIGNIAMDIAAMSVGEIAIKCGDVAGNVNITIASAQKVGLLLQPEWATKEDDDVDLGNWNQDCSAHSTINLLYTQVSGYDFYAEVVSIHSHSVAGDYGQGGAFYYELRDETDGDSILEGGGQFGTVDPMPRPVKIPSGHYLKLLVTELSGINTKFCGIVHGYKV